MTTTEILTTKGLTLRLEGGRLAVFPKTKLNDDLRNFIRSHKEEIVSELRDENLDLLFSVNSFMREQFEFEVEERTAIMIVDGALSENEAAMCAEADVRKRWRALFIN